MRGSPHKIIRYLEEREIPQLVWRRPPLAYQRRIWFHAASGELEYIKPLLRLWKQRHPEDLLFLTYFSTSARSMINSVPEIDGWAPLPVDLPGPCRRFVAALNPALLVISRTDLWPTILATMADRPIILVASTWSDGSKKTQGFGRWMSAWCLPYLNKICVVSEADQQCLHQFGRESGISITGDPRFDQVEFRLKQRRALPETLKHWTQNIELDSPLFTCVAGSTWPEDEMVLIEAWKKAQFPNARLLLVPHETNVDHIEALRKLFEAHHLTFSVWSEVKNQREIHSPVLIFDQKGWLAELYQLGQLAFVGGSFKKQVHSVMEPLGCGVPVVLGPYFKNNREAMEFATLSHQETFFVEIVTNSESLTQVLKKHCTMPPASFKQVHSALIQTFQERCHATEKTYKEIQQCL
jgi:3-deoxy-D-manno-octulosonic-acid transferase